MRVLIVEDEIHASDKLIKLLGEHLPNSNVVGVTRSVEETVGWLETEQSPDLILMDIELADGRCFNIFELIDVKSPVIFCTAYDSFALDAFQANGIDYLLKPISNDSFKKALSKMESVRDALGSPTKNLVRAINDGSGYKTRFLIRTANKIQPVETKDTVSFSLIEGYVSVMLLRGQNYYIKYALSDLENLLDPTMFFRISRQAIISRQGIKNVTLDGRFINLELFAFPETQRVSRDRIRDFENWFEKSTP